MRNSAPDLTDEEVRESISGNLCRCTGYQNIVEAVQSAAQTMYGGRRELLMATRVFGQPIRRNEDERLVTGMGNFVDDISAPGALEVAFLRSPEAHARIVSLDVSRAREHPGVVAVYTHADLGEHDIELPLMIPHPCMPYPKTQRLLAHEEVHYVGQTIAMVVADSRYIAEDALELIELDYDPLPSRR